MLLDVAFDLVGVVACVDDDLLNVVHIQELEGVVDEGDVGQGKETLRRGSQQGEQRERALGRGRG